MLTGSHVTDEEIKMSEDKFAESLHLAQMGMFNLLENDVSFVIILILFFKISCLYLRRIYFLGRTNFSISDFC